MLDNLFSEFFGFVCEEVAVRPEAVIGDLIVVLEFMLDKLHLMFPQVEPLDEPEAVAPRMVVLLVAVVDRHQEILLLLEVSLVNLHYAPTVVPNLEVLLQGHTYLVQEFHLLLSGYLELIDASPAVLPCVVISRVMTEHFLGKHVRPLAYLSRHQYGSEVSHDFHI